MSKIDAGSISFNDFLTLDSDDETNLYSNKLIVPAFQRNYAWDKKHIYELIDSINDNNDNYYIGNILIENSNGNGKPDIIIDGQQRITTLMLILSVVGDLTSDKKVKNNIDNILFFNKKEGKTRLSFTRKNLNNAFHEIVCKKEFTEEDKNSKKFYSNKKYIEDKIKDYSKEEIKNIYKKIESISFVVIRFNQGKVHELFEGLNSKGKPLTSIQLIKNTIFGQSKTKNEKNEKKIISVWESMEKNYEKKEHNILWFDKFFKHFAYQKYGHISNSNVFLKIKKEVNQAEDILNYSTELESFSELYIKVRSSNLFKKDINANISEANWSSIISILKHISNAELEQVYSVLFAFVLRATNNTKYAKKYFLNDLKKIWAYTLLSKYLVVKPSLYESIFANLCQDFKNLPDEEYKKSIKNFFLKLQKHVNVSDEDKFVSNLKFRLKYTGGNEEKITYKNNRNYISLLLYFYFENGCKFSLESLTVEHIIPKGKKDGLKKWVNIKPEHVKEIKNNLIFRLGNLLLMQDDKTGILNFPDKYNIYKKDFYNKGGKIINSFKDSKDLFESENPGLGVEKRGTLIASKIFSYLMKILN